MFLHSRIRRIPFCLIQFWSWVNSLFPLLALWGNKNWTPQYESEKNRETLCLIQFWSWVNVLFPILALWGNKNWPPSMKVKKLENLQNKRGLTGCK